MGVFHQIDLTPIVLDEKEMRRRNLDRCKRSPYYCSLLLHDQLSGLYWFELTSYFIFNNDKCTNIGCALNKTINIGVPVDFHPRTEEFRSSIPAGVQIFLRFLSLEKWSQRLYSCQFTTHNTQHTHNHTCMHTSSDNVPPNN